MQTARVQRAFFFKMSSSNVQYRPPRSPGGVDERDRPDLGFCVARGGSPSRARTSVGGDEDPRGIVAIAAAELETGAEAAGASEDGAGETTSVDTALST